MNIIYNEPTPVDKYVFEFIFTVLKYIQNTIVCYYVHLSSKIIST